MKVVSKKNGMCSSLDKFTVSVLFRGQILYGYYRAYLQFWLICDKLETSGFKTDRKTVVNSRYLIL